MRTRIAVAALLLATSSGALEKKGNWTIKASRLGANVATLPDRCPDTRNELDFDFPEFHRGYYSFDPVPGDPESGLINAVLAGNESSLSLYIFAEQKLRFYSRRAGLMKRFESEISDRQGDRRLKALEAYGLFLLYVGEFEKIRAFYGPGDWAGAYKGSWILNYVMNQALFRLGRSAEALPFAERAQDLAKALDTRWALLTTQLWLYGDDFWTRFRMDGFTLSWIKKLFPNRDADAFPFEIATDTMGVASWSGTGAISFVDIDHDGFDELLVQRAFFPPKMYRNVGGERFEEVPAKNIEDNTCTTLIQLPGDIDDDGEIDLFRSCCDLKSFGRQRLLKNVGGFKFKDVTRGSGFDGAKRGVIHGSWGDYDLDGCLDFAMADQYGPTRLFKGHCDGTFTDVTEKAGVKTPGEASNALGTDAAANTFGAISATFGDYDNDGYPDLFTQGWGWKRLYHNRGDGTFEDVTAKAGIDSGEFKKGYNSLFFDYDNDGWLDIYAGQYVVASGEKWGWVPACSCSNLLSKEGYAEKEWRSAGTIYRNNHDGTFTDMWKKTRFIPLGVMGMTAADLDNDGHVDIIQAAGGPYFQQAEPYLFYMSNGDGTFRNVTPFTALSLWGKGHGVAVGDYDHDGFLDIYLNNGGTMIGDAWPSQLLHNKGNKNHWLEIRLKPGPGSNKLAAGAQVRVDAGELHQLQQLALGGGFSSVNSLTLHFGLGKNEKVDRVEVRWPNKSKTKTVVNDIPADQAVDISETEGRWSTAWRARVKK